MAKPIVVYTSGSWDLFHVGHLKVIERSRALGDRLIVGVSTDELIADYKGLPPVIPFEERMCIVEALKCVDKAVKQTVLTDIRQLKEFDIDIVTIGDDWKDRYLEGLEWMKAQPGKQVVYLEYTSGVSSTGIKRGIIKRAYDIIYSELQRENQNAEHWKNRHQAEHDSGPRQPHID